jgi:flagellar hook-length control protein FliK
MLTQAHIFQALTPGKAPAATLASGGNNGGAQGLGKQFKSLMESLMARVDDGKGLDMDALMNMMNLAGADGEKSSALLTLLADKLPDSGMIPGRRMVGEEGLDVLGQLLASLGFNADKINTLIESLKRGSDQGRVSLSSLMSRLGEFVQENDRDDELDLSALPYMESLLNSFALPPAQVESMMAKASQSGSGLDLDVLLADLKRLSASQNGAGTLESKGQASLIKDLGLGTEKAGTLTLDEFVSRLESLIREKNPAGASSGALESLSRAFAGQVKNLRNSGTDRGQTDDVHGFKNPSDGLTLNFDTPRFKMPQPSARESADSAFFSGTKAEALKALGKEALKNTDAAPSVEKIVKEALTRTHDDGDTTPFTVKALSGSDIYGKVSDMKATGSAEKNLPSYVTDQVARQISKAIKLGESEISFSIRPPEMGRVQLSIENTRDGLRINIVTEQHATRDMILSHTTDLRTLLADQGIRLDKLDVDVSGNFGQSMAQARQEAENSGSGKERKNRDKAAFNLDRTTETVSDEHPARSWRQTRGNLDLVA